MLKDQFPSGWKSNLSGFGMMAFGVLGYVLDVHDANTMMQYIFGGTTTLGVSHKIEKSGQ